MILRGRICAAVSSGIARGRADCVRARSRNSSGRTSRCTIRERCRQCHKGRRRSERSGQRALGRFANAWRSREEIAAGRLPRGIVFVRGRRGRRVPIRLRWAGDRRGRFGAQPFAVAGGFVPGDCGDGLLRMIEIWVAARTAEAAHRLRGRSGVLGVGDLRGGELEGVDPDAMDRAFAVLAGDGSHEEPGSGDADQRGFECGDGVSERRVEGIGCRVFRYTG